MIVNVAAYSDSLRAIKVVFSTSQQQCSFHLFVPEEM